MIYPKRIVFENSRRSQELSLSNNGKDTARYVISVVQIRMTNIGNFETIVSPDSLQYFADKNFRFFPRSVVLAPNESQTVKIQVIKTNELATGEYRSHLYLRTQEQKSPPQRADKKESTSISILIKPVLGVSIPVIIKIGESDTKVNISDIVFNTTKDMMPALNFKFTRSGNMSAYGDITVTHTSTSGKTTKVGLAQGVAIYTPTKERQFHLLLDKSKSNLFKSGMLRVTYLSQSPTPATLAESEISLN